MFETLKDLIGKTVTVIPHDDSESTPLKITAIDAERGWLVCFDFETHETRYLNLAHLIAIKEVKD